jgi:L-asparaginase
MASSLVIIDTGGTMSKTYPRVTLGYAFEMGDEPAAVRILKNVSLAREPAVVRVCAKDSTELTDDDRAAVAAVIRREHAAAGVSRFVICHGTDTMVETGRFLMGVCGELKCAAVLVGAKLPESFKGSDADFNLGFAMATAQLLPVGCTYIAMNATWWRCDAVQRDELTGVWKSN